MRTQGQKDNKSDARSTYSRAKSLVSHKSGLALTQQRLQSIDKIKNADTLSVISKAAKEFNPAHYGLDSSKVIKEEPYKDSSYKKANGTIDVLLNRKASIELSLGGAEQESSPNRTIIEQTTEGNLGVNPAKKQELRKLSIIF